MNAYRNLIGILRGSALLATGAMIGVSSAAIVPMPLISRGVPAYASSVYSGQPASHANDGINDPAWRSNAAKQPAWVAYDLSAVPPAQRTTVLAVWYSKGQYNYYDSGDAGIGDKYNFPGPYVIEANTATGGGSAAPTTGWIVLDSSENPVVFNSREFVLSNFSGNNWIRFRTTATCPNNDTLYNSDVSVKFDVYDISNGITDAWIAYGNSVQANTWQPEDFNARVHALNASYSPAFENGGFGGITSGWGAAHMSLFMSIFKGKYAALCYGVNDANSASLLSTAQVNAIYANFQTMCDTIIAHGKTPVVPSIIWSNDANANHIANLVAINTALAGLHAWNAKVIQGPDVYSKFAGHSTWIGLNGATDDLHPTAEGMDTLESVWAHWAFTNMYSGVVGVNRQGLSSMTAGVTPRVSFSVSGRTLSISTSHSGAFRVFDLLGNLVADGTADIRAAAKVRLQSRGVYFLRFGDSPAARVVAR